MPAKFEQMRKTIADSLRKAHPDWSSDKVKSVSYATATKVWQHKYGRNP